MTVANTSRVPSALPAAEQDELKRHAAADALVVQYGYPHDPDSLYRFFEPHLAVFDESHTIDGQTFVVSAVRVVDAAGTPRLIPATHEDMPVHRLVPELHYYQKDFRWREVLPPR